MSVTPHQHRWDRAATAFDSADFVHRRTCDGLFDRLEPMRLEPTRVVDLGAATGTATALLAKRYRRAEVIAVDSSAAMLELAKKKRPWFSKMRTLRADARQIPLDDHSVDLVFCNLLLPHIHDVKGLLTEVSRLLRKDGLFLFSTLGPDSFAELRDAWQRVDDRPHVANFADMHDVGDAMLRARFREPVLDVEHLTVSYRSSESLFADLTAAGARGYLPNRQPGLVGKHRFQTFRDSLESEATNDAFGVTLELVFGHCWGGGVQLPPGETRVAASSIRHRT
ncbi:MAG: methyltransferase domain-containing protein [Pseudomonadota bacterium]